VIFDIKNLFCFSCIFSQFFIIKTLGPDWIRIRIRMVIQPKSTLTGEASQSPPSRESTQGTNVTTGRRANNHFATPHIHEYLLHISITPLFLCGPSVNCGSRIKGDELRRIHADPDFHPQILLNFYNSFVSFVTFLLLCQLS
jgi:hypothetical protein